MVTTGGVPTEYQTTYSDHAVLSCKFVRMKHDVEIPPPPGDVCKTSYRGKTHTQRGKPGTCNAVDSRGSSIDRRDRAQKWNCTKDLAEVAPCSKVALRTAAHYAGWKRCQEAAAAPQLSTSTEPRRAPPGATLESGDATSSHLPCCFPVDPAISRPVHYTLKSQHTSLHLRCNVCGTMS